MIIEIKAARTWQIWIDGVKPDCEWVIGEEEEHDEHYRRTTREFLNKSLKFTLPSAEFPGHRIVRLEWIAFDAPEADWVTDIDGAHLGPTVATIKFYGEEPILADVSECWFLDEKNTGPVTKGVKLESGEWLEMDETVAFIRIETKEGSDEQQV